MTDLLALMNNIDNQTSKQTKVKSIRAPFGWPGGKSKAVQHIIPRLPYTPTYVEPFGGTGIILLNRKPVKLEVLNDRYMGIVAFYRVIQNQDKLNQLIEKLDLTIHSREDFEYCRDSWENYTDDVERAFRWYYMICYSFTQLGRNFGRATAASVTPMSGKIRNKLTYFQLIHDRLKYVMVENLDWRQCLEDFDSHETVFYIDPPYLDSAIGNYKHAMTIQDHRELVERIFELDGFVALSGYPTSFYDNLNWDNRFEWEQTVTAEPLAFKAGNYKEGLLKQRTKTTEVLWIKEAR